MSTPAARAKAGTHARQGRRGREVLAAALWSPTQGGRVAGGAQKVRVGKPRLRRRGRGRGAGVPIPAYAAMHGEERVGRKVRAILLRGGEYAALRGPGARGGGPLRVSKIALSRDFQEASAEALRELCERRFVELDLPIIYIDGKHFGGHQVICAVGADTQGRKHVLVVSEGATENTVVVRELLEDLVQLGMTPGRKRLFVIDGSKVLRAVDRGGVWGGAPAAAVPPPQAPERAGGSSPTTFSPPVSEFQPVGKWLQR